MPVSHRFDSGVLSITASGSYAPDEIPRELVTALAEPQCPTPVGLLLDVRDSGVMAARNPHQIRFVAEFLEPYAERIGKRCAVVVDSDVQYGLTRMGAVYCEGVGVETGIFHAREEALAWLGAPPAEPGRN